MYKRLIRFITLVMVLNISLFSVSAHASEIEEWMGRHDCNFHERPDIFVKTLEGESDIVANCVKTSQDSGFVITGYTGVGSTGKYLFLAKFDSQCELDWIRVHGKSNSEGRCVVETHDGDFVVVGFTEGAETETDWFLLKFSSSGGCSWVRTWAKTRSEEAHDVIETSDHNIWVVGFSNSFTLSPYRNEVVLAKIAADGNSFTGARAGNPSLSRDFYGFSLAEVFDTDGICVAGRVTGPAIGQDVLLAKFNHTPEFRWAYRIGDDTADKYETARGIVRTSDACLALAGPRSWYDGMYMNYGGFLLKTDPDAQVDWARSAGGYHGHTKEVRSVVETEDGGLVVTGGYDYQVSSYKVLLSKWNLDGQLQWSRGFGDFWEPIGYSVVEDIDRSLLVAGTTAKDGGGDALLARCCCIGLTCLDPAEGPSFSAWSPSQVRIPTSDAQFTASLSPYSKVWRIPPALTTVCTRTTYTVCPDGSGDFVFIQDAIDAAANGDIIELCDDEFTGVGNRDLDFGGKCITVRSQTGDPDSCIINCQDAGRGFYFHSGEECHSIVEGITITNGTADNGGGIYCEDASPTITGCTVRGCDADGGSAIDVIGGSPEIEYCGIFDCGWYGDAAAIEVNCLFGSGCPTIDWCIIAGNYGAGISLYGCGDAEVEITHCTIACNGIGVSLMYSDAYVGHSILWGNDDQIVLVQTEPPSSSITCYCCDIEGEDCSGENNIDANPLFCEPCESTPTVAEGFHLQWGSPCDSDSQPICGLIGALDVITPGLGDINSDCKVTIDDASSLVYYLYGGGEGPPHWQESADVNEDGYVDISDAMRICYNILPKAGVGKDETSTLSNQDYGKLKVVCSGPRDPGDTMHVVIVAQAENNAVEAIGIEELLYPACLTPVRVSFYGEAAQADTVGWSYETTGSVSCEDSHTLRLGILVSLECDSTKYLSPGPEKSIAQIEFQIRGDASLGAYPVSVPEHKGVFSVLHGSRHEPVIEIVDSIRVGVYPQEESSSLPKTFALAQNYPNPFNSSTFIRYSLPAVSSQRSAVSLKVYNLLGQEIRNLVDEEQAPGYYSVSWDGRDSLGKEVSSGIYFYRLQVGSYTEIKKMVLLK